ncbi:MAG TPA: hypothetical protein EYG21_03395 [Nitrospinaceae bacterium]|nr:hypothetical protein [Nitrospinaceae bacterium]
MADETQETEVKTPPPKREPTIHDDVRVPVFGHSTQDFKLPCGYVDEDGEVHNHVTLKQMTGTHEDMMANTKLVVTERISNILSSCCTRIGDITNKGVIRAAIEDKVKAPCLSLTAADRLAMLLFLRIVSVGEEYRFDCHCPYCDGENKGKSLDLSGLDIKYVGDPTKRLAEITLPKSKVNVTLKILTARGETRVSKLRPDAEDARTLAMLTRIVSLNGKKLSRNIKENISLLRDMPYQDRTYIRKVFDIMEGAVDTDVEVQCTSCSKWFKFSLDLGQVFFSQTENTVSPDQIKWK